MFKSIDAPARKRKTPRMRYRCPSCSKIHDGFPALGYNQPDAIFELTKKEREERAVVSSDLCILDDTRYFLRAVLRLDVAGYDDTFEYGPWIEVSAETFARYAVWYNLGVSPGWQEAEGVIANAMPHPGGSTLGLPCTFRLPLDNDDRPLVTVTDRSHDLFADQKDGMAFERVQALMKNAPGFVLVVD